MLPFPVEYEPEERLPVLPAVAHEVQAVPGPCSDLLDLVLQFCIYTVMEWRGGIIRVDERIPDIAPFIQTVHQQQGLRFHSIKLPAMLPEYAVLRLGGIITDDEACCGKHQYNGHAKEASCPAAQWIHLPDSLELFHRAAEGQLVINRCNERHIFAIEPFVVLQSEPVYKPWIIDLVIGIQTEMVVEMERQLPAELPPMFLKSLIVIL